MAAAAAGAVVLLLLMLNPIRGTVNVDVSGGDGQDLGTTVLHGPGGGGGGGVFSSQFVNSTCKYYS